MIDCRPMPSLQAPMHQFQRIHVVGSSPRSGTTLIFELLTSCFDVEKLGDHEVSIFYGPKEATKPCVSKMPRDLVHVCRLLRWDSKLHVIYMQRDPRDVVVSEHGSAPGEYWYDYPIWGRNQSLLPRVSGHPRFYLCRYEDLVTGPDAEQARIAAAFPFLDKRHAFSAFETAARSSEAALRALKGVRPISAASVGSWRKHLPRVAAQLRAHPAMARAVVDAGYEADVSWAAVCDGVEPDRAESVSARHDVWRRMGKAAWIRRRIARRLGTAGSELRYIAGYRKPI